MNRAQVARRLLRLRRRLRVLRLKFVKHLRERG
jgi:hypothetical protein